MKSIDNRPPVKLLPTEQNLSRYTAVFPSERMDNGHILQVNPSYGNFIFTSDYHPDAVQLRNDPNLPASEKEYSTDDNSSSDNSDSFSSSSQEDNEDSDGSYV